MKTARAILLVACVVLAVGHSLADDLLASAKRGDLAGVKHYLLKEPASIGARDARGFSALHWAGVRAHWDVFAHLVAAGADVDLVGGDGGTPLHWASHHDQPEMIELLLERGARHDIANRWGRTPLHVAARRGCRGVAALLISHGAALDAPTKEGWTPLHVAYKAGHPQLVSLLLEAGANADAKDMEGRRPEEHRFERPRSVDLAQSELAAYAGRYALGPELVVKVWQANGGLRIQDFAPDELYPVGPDTFYCLQEPWKVVFGRDEAGAIDSIELHFLRRSVRGERLPTIEYVGSARCAECHLADGQGGQYLHWMRSRHGLAYWRLASDWAKFLAQRRSEYADIRRPIEEPRCLKCHTTGAQDPDAEYAATFRVEEGVGCEVCHGPGSLYIEPEVMTDRAAFLAAGGILPDATTCKQCHQDERFRFETYYPKIAHPRPGRPTEDPHD